MAFSSLILLYCSSQLLSLSDNLYHLFCLFLLVPLTHNINPGGQRLCLAHYVLTVQTPMLCRQQVLNICQMNESKGRKRNSGRTRNTFKRKIMRDGPCWVFLVNNYNSKIFIFIKGHTYGPGTILSTYIMSSKCHNSIKQILLHFTYEEAETHI